MAESAGTRAHRGRRMPWPCIRAINRHLCEGERCVLPASSLAVVAPDWLLAHSDAEWTRLYGHRIEESRLPKSEGDRLAPSRSDGSGRMESPLRSV
jgi:hypothetical protein